jgi:RsiW-degrading membrane proteinase PrsW (M82 family)
MTPSHPSRADSAVVGHRYRVVLASGLLLWAAATATLVLTEDSILLPSVVLIGSFFVPVAAIFWFLDHDTDSELSADRLLVAFFVAGVLGLLAAAALETWLLPHRLWPNLWVGLIEEGLKGAGVIVLARGLVRYSIRDGVLLGTTVGLGFGAFEASGYTLSWGFDANGFSLHDMLSEEALRAVIAPFCHGIWTGLFGAALFAARGRVTLDVVGVYFAISALHALWDAGSNAAVVVTVLAAGTPEQRDDLANGVLPAPSALDAQWLYGAVQYTVMTVVAALGVLWLRRAWRAQPR